MERALSNRLENGAAISVHRCDLAGERDEFQALPSCPETKKT